MKKIVFIILTAFVFVACGQKMSDINESIQIVDNNTNIETSHVFADFAIEESAAHELPHAQAEPVQISDRKKIRDGWMNIEVRDIAKGKTTIDNIVAKYSAYYSGEAYNDYSTSLGYSLVIRIPAASFDDFIVAVESGNGKTIYKNIETRDVTEQFYDLTTRLENKRSYLSRYRELISKATTVKDILEIENSIRTIEEEMESTEGRLRLLTNQIDYSTLNLSLMQPTTTLPAQNFWNKVISALTGGWSGFISVMIFLLNLWPLWVVACATLIVVIRVRKKRVL